jgi:hypothetical protein
MAQAYIPMCCVTFGIQLPISGFLGCKMVSSRAWELRQNSLWKIQGWDFWQRGGKSGGPAS